MPSEVIAQIHRLATMAENYNGIIFTDINGNVLSEQFNKDMDGMSNVPENQHTDHIKGNTANYEENDDTDNVNDGYDGNKVMSQQSESDGNSRNKDQLPDNNEIPNKDMNKLPNDVLLNEGGEEINTEENYGEYIQDPYEEPITIDNVNIMTEMKMLQLAIQQEEEQNTTNQVHTHGYNLREHPTNWKEWTSLAMAYRDRTTVVNEKWQYLTVHPKVHAHIMLMQINIKLGLLAFGERGNEAILNELKQLHDKKAITPIQRMNLTTNKRKKVL